jgi:hypothetical protein
LGKLLVAGLLLKPHLLLLLQQILPLQLVLVVVVIHLEATLFLVLLPQ